jgi:hypothetical protein
VSTWCGGRASPTTNPFLKRKRRRKRKRKRKRKRRRRNGD